MSDTIVAIITCLIFFGLGYIHGYDDGKRRAARWDRDDD